MPEPRGQGGGGTAPTTNFWQIYKTYSTRGAGADSTHPLLLGLPNFFTFRHPWDAWHDAAKQVRQFNNSFLVKLQVHYPLCIVCVEYVMR